MEGASLQHHTLHTTTSASIWSREPRVLLAGAFFPTPYRLVSTLHEMHSSSGRPGVPVGPVPSTSIFVLLPYASNVNGLEYGERKSDSGE